MRLFVAISILAAVLNLCEAQTGLGCLNPGSPGEGTWCNCTTCPQIIGGSTGLKPTITALKSVSKHGEKGNNVYIYVRKDTASNTYKVSCYNLKAKITEPKNGNFFETLVAAGLQSQNVTFSFKYDPKCGRASGSGNSNFTYSLCNQDGRGTLNRLDKERTMSAQAPESLYAYIVDSQSPLIGNDYLILAVGRTKVAQPAPPTCDFELYIATNSNSYDERVKDYILKNFNGTYVDDKNQAVNLKKIVSSCTNPCQTST